MKYNFKDNGDYLRFLTTLKICKLKYTIIKKSKEKRNNKKISVIIKYN